MKFYQACYGKPGNNWELFNVSQDTPPTMAAFFERLGNSCTPQNIGAENTVLADGSPLCLYELISDENILCAIKAQYGERDNFGRPKMFAHGFMMSAENALNDPNTILSIADANFKFDAESTRIPPESLVLEENITPEKAIATLSVDEEILKKMIACVYLLLSSPTDFPLYISCKNTPANVKSAIYYILTSLPLSLRYHLSFAAANSLQYSKTKSIMFVDTAPNNEYYFSLESGQTNLDLTEISSEPEKYSTYMAFLKLGRAEFSQYCDKLQEVVFGMDLAYNASYDDTLVADILLRGTGVLSEKDDTELTKYLLELLVKIPTQNLFVDAYISKVLKIFDDRNIVPNDTIMKRIEARNENTQSEDFVEVYKKIKMRVLLSKGTDEIVSFLTQQYIKSETIFDDWCYSISQIEGGKESIALFYKQRVQACKSFNEIISICAKMKEFFRIDAIKQAIKLQCISITKKQTNTMDIRRIEYAGALADFKRICEKLFSTSGIVDINEALDEIKKNFWNGFRMSDFSFDSRCMDNCRTMFVSDDRRCNAVRYLIALYEKVIEYRKGSANYYDVEKCLHILNEKLILDESDYEAVTPMVQELVCKNLEKESDRHFYMWLRLALFGDEKTNPVMQMIRWKLPIILDEEAFIAAFEESERMQEIANNILVWMIGNDQKSGVIQNLESNPELYKTIKREAKFISDYKKQKLAAQKSREKELQKMEKKKDKEREKDTQSDTSSSSDMFVIVDDDNEVKHAKHAAPKKKGFLGLFDKKK